MTQQKIPRFFSLSKAKIITCILMAGLWMYLLVGSWTALQWSVSYFIANAAIVLIFSIILTFLIVSPIEIIIGLRKAAREDTGEVLLEWRSSFWHALAPYGKRKVIITPIFIMIFVPFIIPLGVLVIALFFYPFRWRVRTSGIRGVPWERIHQYAIGEHQLVGYDRDGKVAVKVPFHDKQALETVVKKYAEKTEPKGKRRIIQIFEIE